MTGRYATLRFLSPYDRIRLLQSVPFFEALEAEDLAAVAEHAEEEHRRRGSILIGREGRADAVRVLVEGEAEMRRHGAVVRRIGPGSPIGFITIVAEDDGTEIITTVPTTSLMLRRAIWFDLLEERFSILHHMIRTGARQLRHECLAAHSLPDELPREGRSAGAVDDVLDRFLVIRDQLPFARRGLFGLWHLARRTSPVELRAGEPLFLGGQVTSDMILLTKGTVRCGEGRLARPGATLGLIDALADEAKSYRAIAETDCAGVRIDREQLLDMFEDHFDVALDCLTRISIAVLDAMEQRAVVSKEIPSGFDRFS